MRLRLALGLLHVVLLTAPPSPAGAADGDHDGVGNARDRCPTVKANQPDGCPLGRWNLATSNHNQTDFEFLRFASLADQAVVGDWNADGVDQVGVCNPATGKWRLRGVGEFGNTPGLNGGDMCLVGDWDGDGRDTIGRYQVSTGTFFLRNSNSPGPWDLQFSFGANQTGSFVRALAGDWNGDGTDTVGIFRRDTNRWRLRDTNSAGAATYDFTWGRAANSELPVVGDVDDDGDDNVGVTFRSGGRQGFQALPDLDASGDVLGWSLGASNPTVLGTSGFLGDWDGDGDATAGVRT
jgi:hypothetical protein